jgi:hypothetical protein
VKNIGAADSGWSSQDLVRHTREQHEIGIELLAAKGRLAVCQPISYDDFE